MAVLGGLTTLLLVYRVLISLPAAEVTDQKLGAVLAVVAALAVMLGGIESMRSGRVRDRWLVHRSSARPRRVSRRSTR